MINNNRKRFLNLTTDASCSHNGFKDSGNFSASVNINTFLFSSSSTWPKKSINSTITQPVSNHVLLQNAVQQTLLPSPHITSQNSPCPYSSPRNQLLLCANFFPSAARGCFKLEMTDDFLKSQLHWGIIANGAALLRTLQLPHACFGESRLFSSLFVVKINAATDGGIEAPQQSTQARQVGMKASPSLLHEPAPPAVYYLSTL